MPGTMAEKDTSLRVTAETKALLDQVREAMGLPTLTYSEFLAEWAKQMLRAADDKGVLFDFSGLRNRIEELERELQGLVSDPKTGMLFDAMNSPRGIQGKHPEPDPDTKLSYDGEGIGIIVSRSGRRTETGVWVKAPSGCYLTERDGTLPPRIIEHIQATWEEPANAEEDE